MTTTDLLELQDIPAKHRDLFNRNMPRTLNYQYFQNKQLAHVVGMRDGLMHGVYMSWERDGDLKEHTIYFNGNPIERIIHQGEPF